MTKKQKNNHYNPIIRIFLLEYIVNDYSCPLIQSCQINVKNFLSFTGAVALHKGLKELTNRTNQLYCNIKRQRIGANSMVGEKNETVEITGYH